MKIKSILILSFLCFAGIMTFSSVFIFNSNPNPVNEVIIEIIGHVQFPGKYVMIKGQKLQEVLVKAKPFLDANLLNININHIIEKNETFVILKKSKNDLNNKFRWKDLITLEDFEKLKVSKSLSEKLLKLRKEKEKVTWDDILNISGIGKVTLAKLKNILVLD